MKKLLISMFVIVLLGLTTFANADIQNNLLEKSITSDNPKPTQLFQARIFGKVKSIFTGHGIQEIEGAIVHCIGIFLNISIKPFKIAFERYENTSITDINGSYSIIVPTPGFYFIYPEKDGYIPVPPFGFAGVYKGLGDGLLGKPVWPALIMIPI
jgi:hypothetical protein